MPAGGQGDFTLSKRGRMTMKERFTAVMKRSGSWWIGWVEEVPGVNCQERTKEALLETIEVTLREALELNRLMSATPAPSPARSRPGNRGRSPRPRVAHRASPARCRGLPR